MGIPVRFSVEDSLIINAIYPYPAGGVDDLFIVEHNSNVGYSTLIIIKEGEIPGPSFL